MGTLLMVLLAIFLPPVAVFLKEGVGKHLLINLILLLLYFPAAIHALIVVLKD
ncbi:MAG: YqaE/Pmp3 family membrane protein [Planctomycetota bacterium]